MSYENIDKATQTQIANIEKSTGKSLGEWLVMDKQTHDERKYDIYLMYNETKKTTRLTDSWKTEQSPVFVKVK